MKNKLQNLRTFKPDEFVIKSSKVLKELIENLLEEKDIISIALSGGSSPLPIYKALSTYNLDWKRIQFYLVDERCVSIKDEQSNYRNINEWFFKNIPSQCYSMVKDELSYKDTASQYEELIKKNLTSFNGLPQFDLIILGMGLDGHTASLFPNTKALNNNQDLIVLNHVPQLDTDRITMTYPLILNANKILLIANGEAKKKILDDIFKNNYPISKIIPQIYNILN